MTVVVLTVLVAHTRAEAADKADEDACRPDVFRLCAGDIPDETAIVSCLVRRKAELSPACRHVIAPLPTKHRVS